ncbi:MAG: HAMP domain-containing histidine kinase [Nitrospinota bacterium]|nr:HAMP domain-containing histidine kinase [Nitrospinota bacterium]MDH5755904.1 HAMP domain-containing histidine kinase [Nitrospinota bacterium]
MRGKLHFRIWLAFMLIVAVALPATYGIARLADPRPSPADYAMALAAVLVSDMAGLDEHGRDERAKRIGQALFAELGVYDGQGRRVAATAHAPSLPEKRKPEGSFFHSPTGVGMAFRTDNGYWVTVSHSTRGAHFTRMVVSLGVFGGLLFIGAFFLSHRLTRRLERLQASVAAWDPKRSPTMVTVEGHDEVAALAESFNGAAGRITRLLDQQRNMLASASHELRTPLARIRLAAEIMAESAEESKRADRLAHIQEDIGELDSLVEDILTASRLEGESQDDSRLEVVDLYEMARGMAPAYGASVEGAPAMVMGDPKALRRMMVNLLENARIHAPGAPPMVEVGRQGAMAFVAISDRGPGLGPEERETVFNPFFRGSGAKGRRGHGLGLWIVKKIAERHGGAVECGDSHGGGAVFEVRLPSARN